MRPGDDGPYRPHPRDEIRAKIRATVRDAEMTAYTICFDFPETEGSPVFAGWAGDQLGFAQTLATCARWASEEEAESYLRHNWSPAVAQHGRVVEVGGDER